MRILALAGFVLLAQQPPTPPPFLQLKEGATWTYVSGTTEGKVRVVGREKIGEVETYVLQTTIGSSSSEKEYLVSDDKGIRMLRQSTDDRKTDYIDPFVRLKLPPAKGDTWEWKGELGKDKASVTFMNDGEEEITVPAGKYKAWKVSAVMEIGGVKHSGANWFAPGVGIIRQTSKFESGGKKHESTIELKKFEPGS